MKLTVIGTGYVGLVAAACFAKAGHNVVGLDIDQDKVRMLRQGRSYFYEPGLESLLREGLETRRLTFMSDARRAIEHGRIIFIAAGTPPRHDGQANLSAVAHAVDEIAQFVRTGKIVVIKSTVPIGTGTAMQKRLRRQTSLAIEMVSNPEFLREGAAVEDFLHPDRVVIGCDQPKTARLVRSLYARFVSPHRILLMSRAAAEMVKYASNAFLATKISYINEIAEICAQTGVDVRDVVEGMKRDHRIGHDFLRPGLGYGGSCFPKDVQALIQVARHAGINAEILDSVHRRNEKQKKVLAQMVFDRLGHDLRGKRIGVWGLAFKPRTDDVRQAPSLETIKALARAGAKLICYDPVAEENARVALGDCSGVAFADDLYEATQDADALVICTEWQQFHRPDLARLRRQLRKRIIFDGRNILNPQRLQSAGLEYYSVGRPINRRSARRAG